jgi:hypothetical protein
MQNDAGREDVNQRMNGTESNYNTANMVMFDMMNNHIKSSLEIFLTLYIIKIQVFWDAATI